MNKKIILKILDENFKPIKSAIDINNELSSIDIKKTSYEGDTIEIKAPLTDNTKGWIEDVRGSVVSADPNAVRILADGNDFTNFFIINNFQLSLNKSTNKTDATISGISVSKLMKRRIATEATYDNVTLSSILEDILKSCGLGGVNNVEYPKALPSSDDINDAASRYVPLVDLEVSLTNDIAGISLEVKNQSVMDYVSDLLKTYGKRMYTLYDPIQGKIKIIINDGEDKTIGSTGLQNLISPENNNINSLDYAFDSDERINTLVSSGDGFVKTYVNNTEPQTNVPQGLNRVEGFFTSESSTEGTTQDQEAIIQFDSADDAMEKVSVSATFIEGFNFGIGEDELFVGDKVSVVVYEKDSKRVIVDDVISAMNIVVDPKKTTEAVPVFIPTIGNDNKDSDGNYMSMRQKLYWKSNKNLQVIK